MRGYSLSLYNAVLQSHPPSGYSLATLLAYLLYYYTKSTVVTIISSPKAITSISLSQLHSSLLCFTVALWLTTRFDSQTYINLA